MYRLGRVFRFARIGLGEPQVLILTPVKDAAAELPGYFGRLNALSYPHRCLSVGMLESDSRDGTFDALRREARSALRSFRSVGLWKRDFGFRLPEGMPRWEPRVQPNRRSVLAKSRNHLLFRGLREHDWVLWLDVDVCEYPVDLIERLLATGKSIVHPHCVLEYGGATFDTNGWRDHGRIHMDALRGDELVELDSVGGTVLWIKADLHRDGLIFPPFPYGRPNPRARENLPEYETEGLALMARDMGHVPWGMPGLEVLHRPT